MRRVGFEIAAAAVEIAAARPEIASVEPFDGDHVPAPDGAYDLVFATHVLEHVPAPARLLAELTRVGRAVVIEVPLEANLAARRPAARAASAAAGHIQHFDRGQVRRLVADAHWTVRARARRPARPGGPPLRSHDAPGSRDRSCEVGGAPGRGHGAGRRHAPVHDALRADRDADLASAPRDQRRDAVEDAFEAEDELVVGVVVLVEGLGRHRAGAARGSARRR